jgi:branched-subunit amino acid transport protein
MSINGFITHFGWWGIFAFVAFGTYFWRGLGVLLAGHVSQESEIFKWLSSVTYAMVGALTIKLILYPVSFLSHVPMWYRILACLLCIGQRLYFRSSLMSGLFLGSALMISYGLYIQYQ